MSALLLRSRSGYLNLRNPTDVPNYDAIEILAEVEVHDVPADISVVSIDEFVPDIPLVDQENHHNLPLN